MKIWDNIIAQRNRRRAEALDLARNRVEHAALMRKYVEQADKIPIPAERCNVTLNLLGRALHYFAVGLCAPTPMPPKKDLPLYRGFLARMHLILDQQTLAAPDLTPMVAARFSLLSSALDLVESRIPMICAVLPSPEETALWINIASTTRTSEPIAKQDAKIEELRLKARAARAALTKEVKVRLRQNGFEEWLEHAVRQVTQYEAVGRAGTLEAMCEAIEEALPTSGTPYDEPASLMTICIINWVEEELLSPRHNMSASRCERKSQRLRVRTSRCIATLLGA